MRHTVAALAAALVLLAASTLCAEVPADWEAIEKAARGQTVYFKAWAGSENHNSYIQWAAGEIEKRHGVELVHVKITNPAEMVSGVLAEKAAGKDDEGSTDLLWINGENFYAMKRNDLLYGPFTHKLPNFRKYVDADDPAYLYDFTVPVEGMEAPWGLAQVVFIYDTEYTQDPPRSMAELLDYAKANPGRVTHPQVRYFMGATFLKQALYELATDTEALMHAPDEATFERVTAPLWAWYDELRPHLWRRGTQFPESGPAQNQLLADGEVDISISFSPFEASHFIETGLFPETVRTYVMDAGSIGNANFLAIPYNSGAKEGALVVVNFMLSPEAQLRGMDPSHRGSFTVLDLDRLSPEMRAAFQSLDLGPATLSQEELGRPLPEPHPEWMNRIVDEWTARYAK
jgi:putative thiamine transport system substrate-binding protein